MKKSKDICGYLPHGLKVCIWDRNINYATEICDIGGVHNNLYSVPTADIDDSELWKIGIDPYTPILYPIEALYKPMEHNGEEILPIVECAKIMSPFFSWELWEPIAVTKNESGVIIAKVAWNQGDNFFSYTGQGCLKHLFEVFDYLNELKIDYRGLIDAGLAVSVYDLENNPYK